jgi:RNA polymerase sigma-70 factor (ECF subfamily)
MKEELRQRDRELLDHLTSGSSDAFWTIWKHHEPHLQAVCVSRMRSAREEAEDAISRSMLLAREKLPMYAADIVNLEAWLTRLVCNVCSDMKKERCRTYRRLQFDADALARRDPSLGHEPTPEESCISGQIQRRIRMAIASLPPRLQTAAVLRFLDGADYPAIAATLSITEPNARKRVQQARDILRRELAVLNDGAG